MYHSEATLDVDKHKEQKYHLIPRFYPNCIETDYDCSSGKAGIIVYYDEDVERMEDMTAEEKIAYKRKLRREGRYTEVTNANVGCRDDMSGGKHVMKPDRWKNRLRRMCSLLCATIFRICRKHHTASLRRQWNR